MMSLTTTTLDNYINFCVLNSPIEFWSKSRDATKFRVLSQLLNKHFVYKNLSGDEYLIERLKPVHLVDADEASRWMNENTDPVIGKPDPEYDWQYIFVLKEDLHLYPHIQKTITVDSVSRDQFRLYSELKKESSIIYNSPLFFTLDKEWIEGAIWFYEKCVTFFTTKHPWPSPDENCHSYAHNYWKCTSAFMDEFLKDLAPKYTDNPSLFNEDFNGITFSGADFYDVSAIKQVWNDRWKIKHQENVQFVNDAIQHLKSHLN